jgi:glutathione S-transferase
MLHELALPFEHVPLDYRSDEVRSPAYLALNPNGRVPTLVDGDLVIWESMAINLYLARRYGQEAGFWPDDVAGEGAALQWSFWVMGELEQPLLRVLMHGRVLPEAKRDPQRLAQSRGRLRPPLLVLDAALAGRDYLVDPRFTVADLNLASVLAWAGPARLDLAPYPAVAAWLGRCLDRPARRAAR